MFKTSVCDVQMCYSENVLSEASVWLWALYFRMMVKELGRVEHRK